MIRISDHLDRLRRLPAGSRAGYAAATVTVIGLVALPGAISPDDTYVLSYVIGLLVFITLAISFNLIAGYAGQFSLGHILFYGLGGYVSAVGVTKFGLHWLPSLAIAVVLATALAGVVGFVTLRLHGIYFATGTLAVAEFSRIAMANWEYVNGATGINLPPTSVGYFVFKWYYVVLAITALTVLVSLVFERTVFGSRLEAIRDNEAKAQAVGINTWVAKNVAFVVSAVPAAAIGAAHVYFLLSIDPAGAFAPMKSIQMQLMVILGGLGTVLGPIVGGALFYGVRETSVLVHPRLHFLITGPLMVLMILYAPEGIVGWIRDRR